MSRACVRKMVIMTEAMDAKLKASYRAAGNRSESDFIRFAVQDRLDAVARGEHLPEHEVMPMGRPPKPQATEEVAA